MPSLWWTDCELPCASFACSSLYLKISKIACPGRPLTLWNSGKKRLTCPKTKETLTKPRQRRMREGGQVMNLGGSSLCEAGVDQGWSQIWNLQAAKLVDAVSANSRYDKIGQILLSSPQSLLYGENIGKVADLQNRSTSDLALLRFCFQWGATANSPNSQLVGSWEGHANEPRKTEGRMPKTGDKKEDGPVKFSQTSWNLPK